MLGIDLLVDLLDSMSFSLRDFLVLVGDILLMSWLFDCGLIRRCVVATPGVWLIDLGMNT